MSVKILIGEIAANFQLQQELYLTIADLSAQQLALLKKDEWLNESDALNDLLDKRKNIVKQIDQLNSHNKLLQAEVERQLGVSEFVLSKLKPKLKEEQYALLSQIVVGLGDLLADITNMDEQSQLLIKRKTGISKTSIHSSSQQAKNAYKDAMQQTKKPTL